MDQTNDINIYKGRRKVLPIKFEYDISPYTFVAEIRVSKSMTSDLIATFESRFATDGKDGELLLILGEGATAALSAQKGFLRVRKTRMVREHRRTKQVFDEPIEVMIHETALTTV